MGSDLTLIITVGRMWKGLRYLAQYPIPDNATRMKQWQVLLEITAKTCITLQYGYYHLFCQPVAQVTRPFLDNCGTGVLGEQILEVGVTSQHNWLYYDKARNTSYFAPWHFGNNSVFIVDLNATIRIGFKYLTADYQKLWLEIPVGVGIDQDNVKCNK